MSFLVNILDVFPTKLHFYCLFFVVPAVTIVVEGGKDTITNMYHDLRDNIPVVIIDVSKLNEMIIK
jgi:hypothetical protein